MSVSTAMSLGSTIDVFATEDPNITEAAEQELQIYEKKVNSDSARVCRAHLKCKILGALQWYCYSWIA